MGIRFRWCPSIAGGSVAAPPASLPEEATLSNDEILRYSRHLILPEVGIEGQQKLKAAKVLMVGAGGLGAPLGLYLAAAGIGKIGMVDFDVVDFTNLQRQVIHSTKDVGRKKLDSAAEKMVAINPYLKIEKYETALTQRERARDLQRLRHGGGRHRQFPDAVPGERCLCAAEQAERLRLHLPLRGTGHGVRDRGRSLLSLPVSGAAASGPGAELCGRRSAGDSAGVIGLIQATEAVKLILGIGEPLVGRLMLYDALGMRFRELKLRKNPECPICGDHRTITKLIDYHQFCGVPQQTAGPGRGDSGEPRRDRRD
jgi:adenylyltransferase/sulfurtransferase